MLRRADPPAKRPYPINSHFKFNPPARSCAAGYLLWSLAPAMSRQPSPRITIRLTPEEHAALARLLGDEETYRDKLREAHRLYTEMGATGHAKRLAKELGL